MATTNMFIEKIVDIWIQQALFNFLQFYKILKKKATLRLVPPWMLSEMKNKFY